MTMDFLYWEAMSRANVNEIAEHSKKEAWITCLQNLFRVSYLNLLVDAHRATDLVWLRDVSPD
nr:TonB box, N-terminal, putative [Medicago truncatula]